MRSDYPNNWELYKNMDDDEFVDATFDEFMMYKVHNWQLPSNVICTIRTRNIKTDKVKEYVCMSHKEVNNKLIKLLNQPNLELYVCDHVQIQHITAD